MPIPNRPADFEDEWEEIDWDLAHPEHWAIKTIHISLMDDPSDLVFWTENLTKPGKRKLMNGMLEKIMDWTNETWPQAEVTGSIEKEEDMVNYIEIAVEESEDEDKIIWMKENVADDIYDKFVKNEDRWSDDVVMELGL